MTIKLFDNIEIDRLIIEELLKCADITSAQLAKKIGLSLSATNERIRRLRQQGVIKKTVAVIDSKFFDLPIAAIIMVLIDHSANHAAFLKLIQDNYNVFECHHITGDYSFLLKVRVSNIKNLENLVNNSIKAHHYVIKTNILVVLSSPKDSSIIVN
jgi:Lrp/AsnC family leucine-responsive transcriptional regulator